MRPEWAIAAVMGVGAVAGYWLSNAGRSATGGLRGPIARTLANWRARPVREALLAAGWAAAYAAMLWVVVDAPAPLNVLLVFVIAAVAVFGLDRLARR